MTRAAGRAASCLVPACHHRGCAQEGCPQDLLHQYSPFEVGLCLEGRTQQTNILSWSQNTLLLPLVLGLKGWIRCEGQLGIFHFSGSSWIYVKQHQPQEHIPVSFSGGFKYKQCKCFRNYRLLNQLDHNTEESIPGVGINKMGKQELGEKLSISGTYWT